MDKVAWMALLFDFYGQLLTKKQKSFIDLYYGHDLSLGEIAENYDVSRQAVYYSLKRSEKVLSDYEDKLGLVKRFLDQRKKLSKVARLLDESEIKGSAESVVKARQILARMLEISSEG